MAATLDPDLYELVRRTFDEWIPFNRALGLALIDVTADRTTATLDMKPDLVGNPVKGILHGGVISATLDAVGGIAALAAVFGRDDLDLEAKAAALSRLGTIDIRVDYLRPGAGERFEATAYPMRAGNTVAVSRMEFHGDDGVLLAVGTGTYIIG